MNLDEFLQQSVGEWMSQQTNHQVADGEYASGRSVVNVEPLSASSPELVKLCQQHNIAPDSTGGGLKLVWTGRLDGDLQDRTELTVMVFIPEAGSGTVGQLVRTSNGKNQPAVARGTYAIGEDGAMSMTLTSEAGTSEERVWFASENLRMRSTVSQNDTGFSAASLSSDIRKITTKPAA